MMRGHRQLVGLLGCIWGLDEGNQGVTWIKKKVGVSKSPPSNSLSLSHRPSISAAALWLASQSPANRIIIRDNGGDGECEVAAGSLGTSRVGFIAAECNA